MMLKHIFLFTAANNVSLKLENEILRLGQSALFKCQVNNGKGQCSSSFRWFGEAGHRFLCQNEQCKNPNKYKETEMGQCTSMLKINDISLYDITTYVTCQYAFDIARVQMYPFKNTKTDVLGKYILSLSLIYMS